MDIQRPKFPFEPQKSPRYKPITTVPKELAPKIISAMMAVPYQYAQGLVPGLERFTQQEIKEMYEVVLSNPPQNFADPPIIQFPFSAEEDVILLSYINKTPKLSFDDFISRYGYIFNPSRTKSVIQTRIFQLQNFSPDQIDKIYEDFARTTVKEERMYNSIMRKNPQLIKGNPLNPNKEQCYCLENSFIKNIRSVRNPSIDEEITAIEKSALGLISKRFESNDLAILLNEHIKISMKHKFLVLGRQSSSDSQDNDIDLGFFNSMVCTHVSRAQAAIQFMEDGKFYCKNIGDGPFRINGTLILPKNITVIQNNDIFDFSDTIFLFFINIPLVNEIIEELEQYCKNLEEEEEEEEAEYDDSHS